jgi:hypothetical protein
MANHSRGQDAAPGTPAFTEPEVHRWPHPVELAAERTADPAIQYIQCAISYQNQLLPEIKTLLEQIVVNTTEPTEET